MWMKIVEKYDDFWWEKYQMYPQLRKNKAASLLWMIGCGWGLYKMLFVDINQSNGWIFISKYDMPDTFIVSTLLSHGWDTALWFEKGSYYVCWGLLYEHNEVQSYNLASPINNVKSRRGKRSTRRKELLHITYIELIWKESGWCW